MKTAGNHLSDKQKVKVHEIGSLIHVKSQQQLLLLEVEVKGQNGIRVKGTYGRKIKTYNQGQRLKFKGLIRMNEVHKIPVKFKDQRLKVSGLINVLMKFYKP